MLHPFTCGLGLCLTGQLQACCYISAVFDCLCYAVVHCGSIACGVRTRVQVVRDLSECGNGVVEGGEACDDGNTADGDGCSSQCQVHPLSSTRELLWL